MATALPERMIPTIDTLVKYDNPILVTTRPDKVITLCYYLLFFIHQLIHQHSIILQSNVTVIRQKNHPQVKLVAQHARYKI